MRKLQVARCINAEVQKRFQAVSTKLVICFANFRRELAQQTEAEARKLRNFFISFAHRNCTTARRWHGHLLCQAQRFGKCLGFRCVAMPGPRHGLPQQLHVISRFGSFQEHCTCATIMKIMKVKEAHTWILFPSLPSSHLLANFA